MCISEYLLFKFNRLPHDLVNAPQGPALSLSLILSLILFFLHSSYLSFYLVHFDGIHSATHTRTGDPKELEAAQVLVDKASQALDEVWERERERQNGGI